MQLNVMLTPYREVFKSVTRRLVCIFKLNVLLSSLCVLSHAVSFFIFWQKR